MSMNVMVDEVSCMYSLRSTKSIIAHNLLSSLSISSLSIFDLPVANQSYVYFYC